MSGMRDGYSMSLIMNQILAIFHEEKVTFAEAESVLELTKEELKHLPLGETK
ncbi:hypothetical protein [Paenibacillus sp. SYP-B4298]|uniref:hypothetical protein n=1 Tax=Paenibacillus sp. SYP-B4298 TaxID=2996034 RepID=UPI0022DDADF8|nr:hypothetical protein [Paenibacillus sp. SYP-B4298]